MFRGVRQPLNEYAARRIAFIKPSALGDIIHSLPVLTALRRKYPSAYISWIVNRGYEPLIREHPDLDATIPFDRSASRAGLKAGMLNYLNFFRKLRREKFDMVVDLQGLLRTGLMSAVSGASRRVGLASAREGAVFSYTDVIHVRNYSAIHAVDRYWLVAEALGMGREPKVFNVPISPNAKEWAQDLLHDYARPWIFLGVGSRWLTKRWPPEHFASLAGKTQAKCGGTVFFVGGSDETHLARRTAGRLGGPSHDLTGCTSLPQLAALLSNADVMVANDTGPLHLAAALGRPVVAPYTCTKIRLSGPYGQEAGAVETRVWCQGSYVKKCDRLECMAELTPDRLWPVMERILSAWQSNSLSA